MEDSLHGVIFRIAVTNDGVIEAGLDAVPNFCGFTFYDAVTGTGIIEIGVNAVALKSSVGSGQTLHFHPVASGSGAPTLVLDDPQTFAGVITGFDQHSATGDQLIIETLTWRYENFVLNSSGTGGSLMFSNGSSEAAVSLAGTYQPDGFHAVVSNGGQTTITYSG